MEIKAEEFADASNRPALPDSIVKSKRVQKLVGIYNALDDTTMGADGVCEYPVEKIKNVLETVKHLLLEDGVQPSK